MFKTLAKKAGVSGIFCRRSLAAAAAEIGSWGCVAESLFRKSDSTWIDFGGLFFKCVYIRMGRQMLRIMLVFSPKFAVARSE